MEMDQTSAELEKLLQNVLPDFSDSDIVIWGTGNTARLYQEGLRRFSKKNTWFSISAYCDGNPTQLGTAFCGKPVISPDELRARNNNSGSKRVVVFICAQRPNAVREIKERLVDLGIPHFLLDEVILKTEAEQVLQCYELLEDETSRTIYAAAIRSRLLGEDAPHGFQVEPLQYFSHPYWSRQNKDSEVFVDCGAYTGDTLEDLLCTTGGKIKKYIAFEADGANYELLQKNAKGLQQQWGIASDLLCLNKMAVGSVSGQAFISHDEKQQGISSLLAGDSDAKGKACTVVTLDECISEHYSVLKADIESYEYEMLLGAKNGIKANRPFLAICIYHNPVDLYSIPLLIHELVPEYHFSIMHHSNTYADTVLYAWCEDTSQ